MIPLQPLNDYIREYLFDKKTFFHRVFVKKYGTEPVLRRFLDSRLDINRLKAAAEFIDGSLFKVVHWKELGTLRKAVTEREVRRAMRYERYRDHTCHTLWGFLLGCLWFERSPLVRQHVGPYTDAKSDALTNDTFIEFAAAWTLGFLCHDIGYLFESDIPGGLTPDPLTDLQGACALLNDFYQSIYVTDFVGTSNIKYVIELEKLGYPTFANNSLAIVARDLRRLPLAGIELIDKNKGLFPVPADVFDLFRSEGCKDADAVETAFRFLYEKGKYDQKFLDHGISSGLLMAQLLVLGYGLYLIARNSAATPPLDSDFAMKLNKKTAGDVLTIAMLRTRIRWIFAAARHNLDPKWWKKAPKIKRHAPSKLSVTNDPPSFFVTLMDTIQDWDRPRMNSNTKAEDFIMDSTDLKLGLDSDRIVLHGDNDLVKSRLKDLEKMLDERLDGWQTFVELA